MSLVIQFRTFLLVLIAATQVVSPVFMVPGGASVGGSVFRVILVAVAVVVLLTEGMDPVKDESRRALIAGGALAAWMLLSLAWTIDVVSGLRQASYIVTTVLLIYVLNALVRDRRDFFFLARSVLIIGAIVLVLALYELQSGVHLFRSSIQDIAESAVGMSYVLEDQAWFTFGNPNDLAVHLTLVCFLLPLFVNTTGRFLAAAIYVVVTIYIAATLDARIVLLALVVFTLVYIATSIRRTAGAAIFIAAFGVFMFVAVLAFALTARENVSLFDVSTFIRLELVSGALGMATQSFFVGVGAGGFETEMLLRGLVGQTYGIVNPHNAIARMIAESGIIGTLLFCFLLFGPLLALHNKNRDQRLTPFIAATIAAMPLLLSSGSDPLSSSSLQLQIAIVWLAVSVRAPFRAATNPQYDSEPAFDVRHSV
jgi:teichuronic acid biosynthesis protein TuaE